MPPHLHRRHRPRGGIAKGTVYLYFDGKEAVFRAMQARNLAEVEVACDAAEAAGGGFGDRLRGVLEALYAGIYDRYGQSEHLVELSSTRLTVGPDIAGQVDQTYTGRIVGFLKAAEKRETPASRRPASTPPQSPPH
uniref:TetR family transcriptional regulator n=1 Tax=Phenylobacterium glaciei TaxID=2803784 RepID=A0A974SAR8_9CAUL|nr:TetR family transcriptional regulator [Phenylobacterium glaciei]